MSRVYLAFATSATGRNHDPDLPLILAAAAARGHQAQLLNWDDPSADWSSFDRVVIRSTWDYTDRRAEYLAWTQSVPSLQNPARVIAWNTDKTYLRELLIAGVPIIETRWNVRVGDDIGSHTEWVCKPSISASARDTARWDKPADVYTHSESLTAAGRTSMVQPYIQSVDSDGETAMLFIGGAFSHAIRKGQLLHSGAGIHTVDQTDEDHITPRAPTAAQHEVAANALVAANQITGQHAGLLYARVDLVTAADGSPLVIELELTEPSLFLPHSEGGADRLIRALES